MAVRLTCGLLRTRPKLHLHNSTCIPDFAQLLYKIVINPDKTINCPVQYEKHITLLVEVKKGTYDVSLASFSKVTAQTDQQARYAFTSYPNTNAFGAIIALGSCWVYLEYDRSHCRPSPLVSDQEDTIYMDMSPPPYSTWTTFHPPFKSLAGAAGYLTLETPKSNQEFALVRRRTAELHNLQLQT